MKIARVARVIHDGSPLPVVALERDGALYDVGQLDARFGTRYAPDQIVGATDFFTRAIALRCAGLAMLDERLRAGDRPTEARILPGTFVWLPPCDAARALHVHVDPVPTQDAATPSYRLGNGRGLLGHEATVTFPAGERRPGLDLGIAAVLAEDLRRATAEEAEQAILGYAIINEWTARDEEARHRDPARARDFAPQLGPLLVTREEIGEVARLRTQARIHGQVVANGTVGEMGAGLAEAIAYVSHRLDLQAGDLIGATCIAGVGVAYGAMVELLIERLGKLAGRPVESPVSTRWRRKGPRQGSPL
jgi:2-keto-4-pentenoate hydratase/2-oxohepta-3-ene-1,7-dioic acid hydratase in catechol pathway